MTELHSNGHETTRLDPMHDAGPTKALWTTVNTAEAIPGVATPLGWTWFFAPAELALRGAFADIGAIPSRDVRIFPDLDRRFIGIFHGHFAGNVDMLRFIGDQMPGSSGDAVEAQFFGSSREGVPSFHNPRRLPIVIAKLPLNAWLAKVRLHRLRDEVDLWWRSAVANGSTRDATEARALFRRAKEYWLTICRSHTIVSMIGQGLYEQVRRSCATAGKAGLELRLLSASKEVYEARMITDLWEVANGTRPMDDFLADHGFHGPAEGELSSRTWREDSTPLKSLLESYRNRERPADMHRRREADRRAAEMELLSALAVRHRVRTRILLRLARTYIPLREEGRGTFLKTYHVARCMARRVGEDLAARGVLDDSEDVFFLTVDELLGDLPADPRSEIAFRRAQRAIYVEVDLPDRWEGQPQPIPVARSSSGDGRTGRIDAIGASPGVAVGRARVIVDPGIPGDLQDGDILVCKTTDPSWASLFFLASACVIDVGGPMSHGAILARELGIPCVINTRDGTRRLRSGDIVRVDGGTGSVEVVTPAAPQ